MSQAVCSGCSSGKGAWKGTSTELLSNRVFEVSQAWVGTQALLAVHAQVKTKL